MPLDLNLTFGGVSFHFSATESSVISPILKVQEKLGSGKGAGSDIIADLSNFTGKLHISFATPKNDAGSGQNSLSEDIIDDCSHSYVQAENNMLSMSRSGRLRAIKQDAEFHCSRSSDGIESIDKSFISGKIHKVYEKEIKEESNSQESESDESETRKIMCATFDLAKEDSMTGNFEFGGDVNRDMPLISNVEALLGDGNLSMPGSSCSCSKSDVSSQKLGTGHLLHETKMNFGKKFHKLCANKFIDVSELFLLLDADPQLAAAKNHHNCFPIHTLLKNKSIFNRDMGRVGDLVKRLISCFPDAVLRKDQFETMPFHSIIKLWIDQVHLNAKTEVKRPSMFFLDYSSRENLNQGEIDLNFIFPEDVVIDHIAEWSLEMLSFTLNSMEGIHTSSMHLITNSPVIARKLVSRISSIPMFLKTILLISDDDVRHRIMSLRIVRRCFFCSSSCGPWLLNMIQRQGVCAQRAVDYLETVSSMDVKKFVGHKRIVRPSDNLDFARKRAELFSILESYRGMIPSLVVLEEREVERVTTTEVVREILNNTTGRPFAVSIVISDIGLHMIYMTFFRSFCYTNGIIWQTPILSSAESVPELKMMEYTIFFITLHFVLRKIASFLALLSISRVVFYSAFFRVQNLLQIVMLFLVPYSTLQILSDNHDRMATTLAITMGLLWITLISYLQPLNSSLATYIISIRKIVKDVFWFLIILIVVMFMFADMTHIEKVNTEGLCVYDKDVDDEIVNRADDDLDLSDLNRYWKGEDDFCQRELYWSYLRVLALVLGDFDFDDYRHSSFVVFGFILFGVLLIVILLNILVALVIDSYAKSKIDSEKLFGRSRLLFAVECMSLEYFFKQLPKGKGDFVTQVGEFSKRLLGRFIVLLFFISLIGTSIYSIVVVIIFARPGFSDSQIFATFGHPYIYALVYPLVAFLALASLVIVKFFLAIFVPQNMLKSIRRNTLVESFNIRLDNVFQLLVDMIGLLPAKGDTDTDTDTDIEQSDTQWLSRLSYLEDVTKYIVSESESRLCEKISRVENTIVERS